jgi:hypothetical protein
MEIEKANWGQMERVNNRPKRSKYGERRNDMRKEKIVEKGDKEKRWRKEWARKQRKGPRKEIVLRKRIQKEQDSKKV